MIEAVGVSFIDGGQVYYFNPCQYKLKKNVTVIVETEKGLQFGKVVNPSIMLQQDKIDKELKKVIRISSKQDYFDHKKNQKDAKEAVKTCRTLIEEYELKMQIIDASFTFDRKQLIIRFIADSRVDFRDLAKDLANQYKTRIELRQIGVRDKAREIGGCGICGQELCCKRFGNEFASVSINMAKNQNLSLNPNKINGACGRLLCCLRYEDGCYNECKKNLPKIGEFVKVGDKKGKVINLDVLKGKYSVNVEGNIIEIENGSN